jgi:MoCo/4Fe-4S cofactor protein with predicted Tat translocation signal
MTKVNNQELTSIRAKLDAGKGREYWRSLEELAETDEFSEFLNREFPQQASEWNDPAGRRRFLKLMGASIALAGASACTVQPTEKIIPYVRQPEEIIPGKPLFFATAASLSGVASPLLVESHMGRPTKVEGNPEHPVSLGATDLFSQASVLTLYDPDRSQTVTHLGDISKGWPAFLAAFRLAIADQRATQGAGMRVLTETVTSPTLAAQLRELRTLFPKMKWHQYEPGGRSNATVGAQMAFGEPVSALYHFDKADVVLSLDGDFLSSHPSNLGHIRDFVGRRSLRDGNRQMNRLYVAESTPSNTGAKADRRLAVRAVAMESLAREIASRLGVSAAASAPGAQGEWGEWIDVLVSDLQQHRGSSLVVAGDQQPPLVHALAHLMNQALGNVGAAVTFTEPLEAEPVDQMASLLDLAKDLQAGQVEALVIIGGNPVYTAPVELKFSELIQKARFTAHLGLYNDESSAFCQWHVPEAHYLESWSDARAVDGTITIVQPLIAPLYAGKTAHEVLTAFTDQPERTSYDIVREHWMRNWDKMRSAQSVGQPKASPSAAPAPSSAPKPTPEFEKFWRKALHDGFVANSALVPKTVTAKTDWSAAPVQGGPSSAGLEVVFRLDPSIHDGRFSNNGWLQELPNPLTKLTWDNAALISKRTAEARGVVDGDVVELKYQGVLSLRAPIMIMPGQADDSITLHLGYGRQRAGKVGNGAGFNAYSLLTAGAPWFAAGVELARTGAKYTLATTQQHWLMEGRDLVRAGTLAEYNREPGYAHERVEEPPASESLFPPHDYPGYAWGMAIDLTSCVGCNACIVACQSENNIPVVGKEQVHRGREMHWLRVDRYYEGSVENPEFHFMPVPCMHCENAPCEVVCPVAATVHSAEGTNDMVYNRCIGTRYCSNNCPYKVRRFNFLLYQDFVTESLKMMRNPDVSVRSRGVMEKCTYCIQRVQFAKIESEKENRPVRDGEIKTACQQTCPADAIVFGDINNPESRVSKLRSEPRHYSLLAELNTRPRTTYLAAVRNPSSTDAHGEGGSASGETK